MLDVYFGKMDGVEVHAETPEEEQEAAFILNSALSGKTTFLGGCLCPSEADSTVSKGFRLMLSEGTDLYVTPALDVDGTPALEICCTTANEEQQEADEPAYTMELGIEPSRFLPSFLLCPININSLSVRFQINWYITALYSGGYCRMSGM